MTTETPEGAPAPAEPDAPAERRGRGQTRPAIIAADLIDDIEEEPDAVRDCVVDAMNDPKHAADCRRVVEYLDRADKLPPRMRRLVVLSLTEE